MAPSSTGTRNPDVRPTFRWWAVVLTCVGAGGVALGGACSVLPAGDPGQSYLEVPGVVFVDSGDAAARRCGDAAAETCATACDVVTGEGTAPCCAGARDAFRACDALVLDTLFGSVPMRLRNLGPS